MIRFASSRTALPYAISLCFLTKALAAAADEKVPGALTAVETKRVDTAIATGKAFLTRTQFNSGTWSSAVGVQAGMGAVERMWAVGYAALPGLTLLETGVPGKDAAVQRAAKFVRQYVQNQTRTYEISLVILFLDRLGEEKDLPLIRSLALRLAGGQTPQGGWGYECPVLKPAQEKKLIELLRDWKPPDKPVPPGDPKAKNPKPVPPDKADNSNTQFAILALWTARKHDLNLAYVFYQVEHRFRYTQAPTGWGYRFRFPPVKQGTQAAMTCVGLLGLAVGRGSAKDGGKPEDDGVLQGLRALASFMKDTSDWNGIMAHAALGPKGALNYYFLWSVERTGVLLNLKTIGGKDWYRWGVELILPEQKKDGSWVGRGSGGSPVIDTCFALLFLKKSDLLPDLRETLQKRLKIVDPGASSKSETDKSDSSEKKTGDKTETPLKNPTDKSDSPKKKSAPPSKTPAAKDAPGSEVHDGTPWLDMTDALAVAGGGALVVSSRNFHQYLSSSIVLGPASLLTYSGATLTSWEMEGTLTMVSSGLPGATIATGANAVDAKRLTQAEQKRVNTAIDNGKNFLLGAQQQSGTWSTRIGPQKGSGGGDSTWAIGHASLPGLTLLELGVPAADKRVQQAGRFVRQHIQNQTRTYEISLAILFLDRLGEAQDRELLRSMALRLVAGQTQLGGWGYQCPLLKPAQEKKYLQSLREWKPPEKPPSPTLAKDKGAKKIVDSKADNSNTQFALLALWTARKYELPLDYPLYAAAHRFRLTQSPGGWEYLFRYPPHSGVHENGAMTCVGLLGLAAGRGFPSEPGDPRDDAITRGLQSLANYMKDPTDNRGLLKEDRTLGPKNTLNYYFLWSVERVAVMLNLKTIGGNDWYRWGVELILPEQKNDGSWLGRGSGSPVIDTCFALLFLKKSDLLPDLRETLHKRLKIVDPGASSKSETDNSDSSEKKTGDKTETPLENPTDKSDSPKKKSAPPSKTPPAKDVPGRELHDRTPWLDKSDACGYHLAVRDLGTLLARTLPNEL
jgi:hypothetical protein